MSEFYSDVIFSTSVPKIVAGVTPEIFQKEHDHFENCINNLTSLTPMEPNLFIGVVRTIVEIIERNIQLPEFVESLLKALGNCITGISSKSKVIDSVWESSRKFLVEIQEKFTKIILMNFDSPSFYLLVNSLTQFSAEIVSQSNKEIQKTIISNFANLFINGKTEFLGINQSFNPFSPQSTPQERFTITIFAMIIANTDKSIEIPDLHTIVTFFYELLTQKYYETNENLMNFQTNISIGLASILNKTENEDIITTVMKKIENELFPSVTSSSVSLPLRLQQTQVIVWVTKSLITRAHKTGQSLWKIIEQLLDFQPEELQMDTDQSEVAFHVAEQMVVLFKDLASLKNCKPLYKQKFFVVNLPSLLEKFKKSQPPQDKIYMTAVLNLLKHTPFEIISSEFQQILPIFLESIKIPLTPGINSNNLQLSAINTFILLAQESTKFVEDHLGSLIPRLLEISSNDNACINLKKSALVLLSIFTKIPYTKLHPYKNQVTRELKKSLDDKKRDVRRVAVKTRNLWFTIGFVSN